MFRFIKRCSYCLGVGGDEKSVFFPPFPFRLTGLDKDFYVTASWFYGDELCGARPGLASRVILPVIPVFRILGE